jgi:hypothetical protein
MVQKVQKVWMLLKEYKLLLLCYQRMLWSFVKTLYSDLVFHMILLSLRRTKGVYPCWETLGVKSIYFGDIVIRKHLFFSQKLLIQIASYTRKF